MTDIYGLSIIAVFGFILLEVLFSIQQPVLEDCVDGCFLFQVVSNGEMFAEALHIVVQRLQPNRFPQGIDLARVLQGNEKCPSFGGDGLRTIDLRLTLVHQYTVGQKGEVPRLGAIRACQ